MFQVFVPKSEETPIGATAQVALPAVGLDDWIVNAKAMKCTNGPGERSGTVYFWDRGLASHERRFGYDPDLDEVHDAVRHVDLEGREWEPDRYAILWPKDAVALPERLAHRYPLLGSRHFPLGGREWLLPSQNDLPCDLITNRAGRSIPHLQDEFRPYGRLADDMLGIYERNTAREESGSDEAQERVSYDQALQLVVASVAINYRVSTEVVNAARLLTTANVMEAVAVACGIVDAAILAREVG